MRRVFADSFYFFALLSEDDSQHQQAVDFTAHYQGKLVTTGWVITEVADGLGRPPWRIAFLALHAKLVQKSQVHIEPCTDQLMNAGLKLYRQRLDKAWSLTDCISFVVMERAGIREALTGDHHFEQAGFAAVLK
ncbi:MAG: PIN domain-containing protein [Pirellulaceae bacterium]